jgi:hypothetical protein
MAFDDSTSGLDRHMHHTLEPIWGNDWGDGKPRRLFAAARIARERAEVDFEAHQKYLARRARIAADATRSRAAPIEAAIRKEIRDQSKTVMGAALRLAMDKADRAKARETALE